MKIRAALALLVVVLAVACSATIKNPLVVQKETVTLDRQRFVSAWEHGRTLYRRSVPVVRELCASGCLTPKRCDAARAAHEEFKRLDLEAETVIRNPEVAPNWPLYFKALEALAGLVL